jgi:CP family cyanate transporter-like MFS transporter
MGLQSSLAYLVFGWLAPILRDRGLSPVDAGLALSMSLLVQAPAALVVPTLAARRPDQRAACVAAVALCLAGLLGCLYAPLPIVWAWATALGIAQGALFGLALTLILLRASDANAAAALSGMAQGVGYLLASAGPFAAGLLHARGGPNGVALLCAALGLATAIAGFGAGRAGHVLERG